MSRDPCRRRDGLHRPRFFSFVPSFISYSTLVSKLSNIALFQLQKGGLSSSLPICTQSMRAPSPASPRSARSTRSCSPVSRLTHPDLPPEPTFSPPRCILPFSVCFFPLTFSQRPWPVDGGEANPPAAVPSSLILTGSFRLLEELSNDASCHITHCKNDKQQHFK